MNILDRSSIWIRTFYLISLLSLLSDTFLHVVYGCRRPILGKFRLDKHLPSHVETSFPDLPPNILPTEGMDNRFNITMSAEEENTERAVLLRIQENMLRKKLLHILNSSRCSLPYKMQILREYDFLFDNEKVCDVYAGGLLEDFDFYMDLDLDLD